MAEIDPNFVDRIIIIEGSLNEANLGIHPKMLNDLILNVQIVIHAAADVRFDKSLLDIININLKATEALLNIFSKSLNLEIFIYISTAYSHSWRQPIDDLFYEPPLDPKQMLKLADTLIDTESKKKFEILGPRLIKPWENNYTYSKALSEDLVRSYGNKMCVAVVRPSMGK